MYNGILIKYMVQYKALMFVLLNKHFLFLLVSFIVMLDIYVWMWMCDGVYVGASSPMLKQSYTLSKWALAHYLIFDFGV